ncbi:MFS transporter [Tomitella biformata]|uniref:MFS transporter n=1 Tax=Tomitella biformata TaxID=630403 RepID=UPI00046356F3|nr:MFS transporter [Tomitella biformata]
MDHTPAPEPTPHTPGTWSELFGPRHRAITTVLAGGVAVYATNIFVTTSLLPNAVADIGGQRYYAWTMTVFLLASVISSMLVGLALRTHGPRRSYLAGFGVFAVGSAAAALAPTMELLLVGRAVQGLGGGLLTGLAFGVLRSALPDRLWPRAIALISAMWAVGNILGPILGGLFAQLGIWRGAFWLLAAAALALCLMSQRALPRTRPHRAGRGGLGVPYQGLVLLTVVAGAISVASVVAGTGLRVGLIAAAAVALGLFIVSERRVRNPVLPRFTYTRTSPLPWVYLGILFLAIGGTVEMFVPLFGQELGGMTPLMAGLLGAALSWGWSAASITATYATAPRTIAAIKISGPAVLAVGLLAYGFLQRVDPGPWVITGWFAALVVTGAGIGMAFAHLITAALSSTDDEDDAAKASAGVNTVQLIANTLGSALAGLLVAVGGPGLVGSARYLTVGFAVIAVLGVLVAVRGTRGQRAPL